MNTITHRVEFPLSVMQMQFTDGHRSYIGIVRFNVIADDFLIGATIKELNICILDHAEIQIFFKCFIDCKHKDYFLNSWGEFFKIDADDFPVSAASVFRKVNASIRTI